MRQAFTAAQFRLLEATIDEQLEESTRVPIVWLHQLWYLESVMPDRLYLANAETIYSKNAKGEWEPFKRGVLRPDDDTLDLILQICRRSEQLHFEVKYAELLHGNMKILRTGEVFPDMTGRLYTYVEGDYLLQDSPLEPNIILGEKQHE